MMTYDTKAAVAAQKKYCEDNNAPFFAPYDRCYYCNHNIYLPVRSPITGEVVNGVSVEEAGERLITGCPFCHHSYVD